MRINQPKYGVKKSIKLIASASAAIILALYFWRLDAFSLMIDALKTYDGIGPNTIVFTETSMPSESEIGIAESRIAEINASKWNSFFIMNNSGTLFLEYNEETSNVLWYMNSIFGHNIYNHIDNFLECKLQANHKELKIFLGNRSWYAEDEFGKTPFFTLKRGDDLLSGYKKRLTNLSLIDSLQLTAPNVENIPERISVKISSYFNSDERQFNLNARRCMGYIDSVSRRKLYMTRPRGWRLHFENAIDIIAEKPIDSILYPDFIELLGPHPIGF